MLGILPDMTLENVFYSLAIVYMILGFVISLVLLFAVIYIKRKIDEIHHSIEVQVERIKEKPGDFAMDIGSAIAASAIKQVKKKFTG